MLPQHWYTHWAKPFGPWVIRYKRPNGTWTSKRVPVDLTHEDDAKAWFASWYATQPVPTVVPADTIEALMLRWIDYLKVKPNADPQASKTAATLLRRYIRPFPFASIVADQLQLSDCVDWIEELQRGKRAPLTIRNVVQQVRTMLSDARGKGWRKGENFFNDSYVKDRLRGAKSRYGDTIVCLSLDQVQQVVGYTGDMVPAMRHARNVLGLTTAMRRGEIAALRWMDISLDASPPHLRVERQLVATRSTVNEPFFKDPKKGSKRPVPLHPVTVPVLRRWHDEGWRQWVGRDPRPEDPVFPNEAGCFVIQDYADQFRRDLGAYGLPTVFEGRFPITFHAARRTFLTLLTDADVPDGDVRAVAGHIAPGVTRKHYVAKNLDRIAKGVAKVPLDDTA